MIAVVLVAYFTVAVFAAALLLLPAVRTTVFDSVAQFHGRISRRASDRAARAREHLAQSAKMSRSTLSGMQNLLVRRRLLIATTTGILATPPLIAIALRGRQLFQYDDTLRVPDEKIAALLKGEQLVPPLPLPPEVFATREVEQVRPALKDASRDWNLLDTDFRTRLLLVYKIMREQHGYEMALLEGYRSPERQTDWRRWAATSPTRRRSRVITNTDWRPTTRSCATASSSSRKKIRGPCEAISCTDKSPKRSA
ncbi:putative l-alanyl-D-glutamate peptidase [Burkholderia thailandensis]|uniref:L-alanyl-D-glutamate peptidase n=1 Tax=Burkholderia thailandensis TaxID=57975 RepID=A0AAW9D344_BURTH|nr:putative l-alanyl-D-glutamate peptidase [Burkholderia thailandensis]